MVKFNCSWRETLRQSKAGEHAGHQTWLAFSTSWATLTIMMVTMIVWAVIQIASSIQVQPMKCYRLDWNVTDLRTWTSLLRKLRDKSVLNWELLSTKASSGPKYAQSISFASPMCQTVLEKWCRGESSLWWCTEWAPITRSTTSAARTTSQAASFRTPASN